MWWQGKLLFSGSNNISVWCFVLVDFSSIFFSGIQFGVICVIFVQGSGATQSNWIVQCGSTFGSIFVVVYWIWFCSNRIKSLFFSLSVFWSNNNWGYFYYLFFIRIKSNQTSFFLKLFQKLRSIRRGVEFEILKEKVELECSIRRDGFWMEIR